ncbi:MAG: aminoacyl-tRNA hydrolase [Caulobacterales bacterium]|nr:aminoacyl-tRNA hydrolase [Caulobacterales bacterium]
MRLLVGLGNPGPKYERNRHNIGFRAVDAIADAHRFGPERSKFQALIREGVIETEAERVKALVLKPQTFMNESGRAVGEAARFFKIPPADIAVFYDEIDLAPGKFRLKTGGGAAGHNGVRSLIAAIGPDFTRARMGVGHPGSKERVHGWVLSDFYKADEDWVDALCDACARAAPLLAAGDDAAFQTRVTYLAPAPKPPASEE